MHRIQVLTLWKWLYRRFNTKAHTCYNRICAQHFRFKGNDIAKQLVRIMNEQITEYLQYSDNRDLLKIQTMNEIVLDRTNKMDHWIGFLKILQHSNWSRQKGQLILQKKKKKDTARRVIASIEIKMLFVELERIYMTRNVKKWKCEFYRTTIDRVCHKQTLWRLK